jgi:hypothetical protein
MNAISGMNSSLVIALETAAAVVGAGSVRAAGDAAGLGIVNENAATHASSVMG